MTLQINFTCLGEIPSQGFYFQLKTFVCISKFFYSFLKIIYKIKLKKENQIKIQVIKVTQYIIINI